MTEEILRKNCARKLWVAPGVALLAKRTRLAAAANTEKSTPARSDFIILQLNKTSFWRERVNEVWENLMNADDGMPGCSFSTADS